MKRLAGFFAGSLLMLADVMSTPAMAATVTVAQVEPVTERPVSWVSGSVTSSQSVNLSAEESGRIVSLGEFGEQVQAGAVLARLDDRQLQLDLDVSRLELKKALEKKAFLKAELGRLKTLEKSTSVTGVDLDRAAHDYALAKLDVDFAQVAIERLEDRLERTWLKAPFNGQVNVRFEQPGQYVSTGTPLLQLVNTTDLDVRMQVPLDVASRLKGERELAVKRSDGEQAIAQISQVAAAADEQSRLVEVRLSLDSSQWLVGTPVQVAIPVQLPEAVKVIPRDALVLRESGHVVFTVAKADDDKRAVRRTPVKVVFGDSEKVIVTGALEAGDEVVVRGSNRVKDRQSVSVVEA